MDRTRYTGGPVPVQAGEVLRRPRAEILAERAAARQASAEAAPGGHANVREGNATVGVQADWVDGPLIIRM